MGARCSRREEPPTAALDVHAISSMDANSLITGEQPDMWQKLRGHEIEAPLRSGAIALLDAAYLVTLAESSGIIQHRQALPAQAFISLDELKATGQTTDSLRIVAVSHTWLQPSHPDPFGHNLAILATVLRARTRSGVGGRWAVFYDYASLFQHPPGGRRTPDEERLFREALGSLCAMYAHQYTIVFLLTAKPPNYPDGYELPAGAHASEYFERGWCFTEASWAMLTKTYAKVLDLGRLSGQKHTYVGMRDECIADGGRRAPLTPTEFEARLRSCTFTNGKEDLPLVSRLYRSSFEAQFGRAEALVYAALGWGDAECEAVVRVLGLGVCNDSLQRLVFDDNRLGDESAILLARLLSAHTFSRLEHVGLYGNSISEAGLAVLQKALLRFRKKTPQLRSLDICRNLAAPRAMKTFALALNKRSVEVDALRGQVV